MSACPCHRATIYYYNCYGHSKLLGHVSRNILQNPHTIFIENRIYGLVSCIVVCLATHTKQRNKKKRRKIPFIDLFSAHTVHIFFMFIKYFIIEWKYVSVGWLSVLLLPSSFVVCLVIIDMWYATEKTAPSFFFSSLSIFFLLLLLLLLLTLQYYNEEK